MGTSPSTAPEAPAPINHFGRILGALLSPRATFEEIAGRPSWVAPVILLTILSLVVSGLLAQKVNWERFVAQSIERSPQGQQLSPEQREQRAAVGAKVGRAFVYVFGVIGTILLTLFRPVLETSGCGGSGAPSGHQSGRAGLRRFSEMAREAGGFSGRVLDLGLCAHGHRICRRQPEEDLHGQGPGDCLWAVPRVATRGRGLGGGILLIDSAGWRTSRF